MTRGFFRLAGLVPLVCALLAFAAPQPAGAAAIYQANIDAVLSLVRFTDAAGNAIAAPNGVTVAADPCACDPVTDQFGTGTAAATGHALGASPAMQPGDAVDLASHVSGSALLPDGYAFSAHDADAVIDLENFSGQTVGVVFRLAYGWDLSAAVGDLDTEQAYASLFIDILGGLLDGAGDFLTIDVDVLVDEVLDSFDLAAPGALANAGGDQFEFTILLAPGDVAAIDLYVETFGLADAFDVPAPAGAALLFAALPLLRALRRRRD